MQPTRLDVQRTVPKMVRIVDVNKGVKTGLDSGDLAAVAAVIGDQVSSLLAMLLPCTFQPTSATQQSSVSPFADVHVFSEHRRIFQELEARQGRLGPTEGEAVHVPLRAGLQQGVGLAADDGHEDTAGRVLRVDVGDAGRGAQGQPRRRQGGVRGGGQGAEPASGHGGAGDVERALEPGEGLAGRARGQGRAGRAQHIQGQHGGDHSQAQVIPDTGRGVRRE